ncbi:MAG: site-2 protease family protein [Ruminococcus sp.]|jgi:Zn-dependent protease|nr:site-2 protease family protein [Ruminococcus sp.]
MSYLPTFERVIIFALIMFISLPVHEAAHAYAAFRLGDDTAKNQGRLTLNPLRHLDPLGSVLMIFVGFGWAKPVPINPNNFRNRKTGFAVSALAGPVSNLILAYLFMVLLRIAAPSESLPDLVIWFVYYGVMLNIGLAVFNLLPIPPLDGSRIFSLVLPEKQYFKLMKFERVIFIVFFILLQTPLFDGVLAFLQQHTYNIMLRLTDWVNFLYF